MLGTLPEKGKADWKAHLSSMTHAYNCTQLPSTTYSPYFLMFGRKPRLPIDFELGLPIDVLGDNCSKTRYVHKLKQRLNYACKRTKEMSQKQAQNYKLSYYKKVKGTHLQIDYLVLVKRVALKGTHKIQNKWEPEEYVVLEQPNKSVPEYKVKPVGNGKERVLHRNMLLPLGIKFVSEDDSDIESDQRESESEQCQVERQISKTEPQFSIVKDMTSLAQSNLEHGQDIFSSKIEHVETPVNHVSDTWQGSMAPPTAISTDQLIDPNMSLDPELLVPIEETVGSDPAQTTHLSSKDVTLSLVLPSTNENSDSLMKTESFWIF